MATIKLTDLIDISMLQEIQDGFSDVTGMAVLTADADGSPVTRGSNFTDLCMKYTRRSSKGCVRCDMEEVRQIQRTGKPLVYHCRGGLAYFAAPITVNGEFIGSLVGGQVLTEKPDEERSRMTARELGVNEDDYIAALGRVKIVSAVQVDKAAKFLHTIAKNISAIAYANYSMKQQSGTVYSDITAAGAASSGAEALVDENIRSAQEVLRKFNELAGIAEKCSAEVKGTNETIKTIKDIAMNTRILGFNASIEASKAKESGKGFGVIAQEVRNLADTSKSSADKIDSKMKAIGGYAREMEESAAEAAKLAEMGIKEMEKLRSAVTQIKER